MAPLHLGVILPNYGAALDAEHLSRIAVAVEESGFDSAWVTDHLIVPADRAATYGTIAEALVSLGFLAGERSGSSSECRRSSYRSANLSSR